MNKKVRLFLSCLLFSVAMIPASASITVGSIVAIVAAVTEVVKVTPNGSYVVTIFSGEDARTVKVDSAAEARSAKDVAFRKGASKIHIESVYPTVQRDCNDDWYYADGRHSDGVDLDTLQYDDYDEDYYYDE